jgi:hypothetical protein
VKINNVTCGIPGAGPAVGQKTLMIEIGEGPTYDFSREDVVFPLYSDFKTIIDSDPKLSQAYREAIDGSMGCFITFKGGEIEKQENDAEFEAFFTLISHDSITLQKTIIGMGTKGIKNPSQLNPPFLIFCGIPQVFTGRRDWYQHFRAVIARIYNDDYSQVALKEMMNHQFSSAILYVDENPVDFLNGIISPKKVSVADISPRHSTRDWAIEKGYRYYAMAAIDYEY